jgi:hypothetical protein
MKRIGTETDPLRLIAGWEDFRSRFLSPSNPGRNLSTLLVATEHTSFPHPSFPMLLACQAHLGVYFVILGVFFFRLVVRFFGLYQILSLVETCAGSASLGRPFSSTPISLTVKVSQ